MKRSACPGCGIVLPVEDDATHAYLGASPACWSLYNEILAREYGDQAYWPVHRLSVDTYAAQHPGAPERRTIRSINVHLVGLHLALDRGWPGDRILDVVRRLATLPPDRFVWRTPPADLGELTVDHLIDIETPSDHIVAVNNWAATVWATWHQHHAAIHALAESV